MPSEKQTRKRYRNLKFDIKEPVLDIGGGDGNFLKSYGVKNATIIDLTENQNKNYNYIKTDITKKLPSFKKKFKTIFIMETLEHIRNPLYLLAQTYDLLDDDGKIYLSVPYTGLNKNKSSEKQKKLIDFFFKTHKGHVNRWKIKEIINQTDKLGFNVKILQKRRRFKGLGFFIPHCWIVLRLTKRKNNRGENYS